MNEAENDSSIEVADNLAEPFEQENPSIHLPNDIAQRLLDGAPLAEDLQSLQAFASALTTWKSYLPEQPCAQRLEQAAIVIRLLTKAVCAIQVQNNSVKPPEEDEEASS
jgi:hypothetical protein